MSFAIILSILCGNSVSFYSLQFFKVKVLKINLQLFSSSGTRRVLLKEYRKLGPWKFVLQRIVFFYYYYYDVKIFIRFAEVQVLICFVSLAILWLLRQPRFMPGWGEIFKIDESSNKR